MSQRCLRCSLTWRVLAGGVVELLGEAGVLLLVLDEDVDAGDGGLDAGGEDLFGELLFVEDHDFLDVADAAAEVFAEGDDLADDDGRAGDGLHDADLAALDALGDLDFALAGEQGDGAHLAQVHADGVVGLLEGAGGEVELDVVGLFAGLGLVLVALAGELGVAGEDVDALGVDGGEQVVEVVGRGDVAGQEVVDLTIGEIALLFARIDERSTSSSYLSISSATAIRTPAKNFDDRGRPLAFLALGGELPGLLR